MMQKYFIVMMGLLFYVSSYATPEVFGKFVFSCEKTVTNTTTGEVKTTVIARKDPNDPKSPFPDSEQTERFFVEMIGGNSKGPTSFSLCDRQLEVCAVGIGKNNIDTLNLFPRGFEISLNCSVWNP